MKCSLLSLLILFDISSSFFCVMNMNHAHWSNNLYSFFPLLCLKASPTVVLSPTESVAATEGETIVLNCSAVGNPIPVISWRQNWHHIPPAPRVTATSVDGLGTLTIRDVRVTDQGAWSCEAINSKDSVLAPHDSILSVKCKCFPFILEPFKLFKY